jgi:hypothetical protein
MLDDKMIFSFDQAITVSAASNYASTGGVIDTVAMGAMSDMVKRAFVAMSIKETFTGPAGSTLDIVLQDSPDGTVWTDTWIQVNAALASLVAGIGISHPLPIYAGSYPPIKLNRFLRMNYTVTLGPFTAGKLSVVLDVY